MFKVFENNVEIFECSIKPDLTCAIPTIHLEP
jgi:hypothetical protein